MADVQTRQNNLLNILETNDDYALLLCQRMIVSLLKSTDSKSKFAYKICAAAEENFEDLYSVVESTFPQKKKAKGAKKAYGGTPQKNGVLQEDWDTLIKFHEAQLQMYEEEVPSQTAFHLNLERLSKLVGFSELQVTLLSYVHALGSTDPQYKNFFAEVLHGQASKFPALLAMVMDEADNYKSIARDFGLSGTFFRYGIIEYEGFDNEEEALPIIENYLCSQLSDHDISDENMIETLIGKAVTVDLTVEDNFPHLKAEAERLAKLVEAAYKKGETGINIAIYGPTGSGKTAFVTALAAVMGKKLFAVGETEEDNEQMSSNDKKPAAKRMASLRRAQAILKNQTDSVLLMDEFEDLVANKSDSSKQADPDSKILLNRTLEENAVVTFWACNDIGKFHDSFRSRFFASVFLGYQPTLIREKIWAHHMKEKGLDSGGQRALAFARRYEAPPRSIASACASAAMLGGTAEDIHREIEDKAKILRGNRYAFESGCIVPENYNMDLLVTDCDVQAIAKEAIAASEAGSPYSILIEGDKGTGKSAYAYYLAERMVRSPMVADMRQIIQPSQFADPEDKLMSVFNTASDANALLIIDNMQAMFKGVGEMDKANLSEAFWECFKSHRSPIVMTTKDLSEIDKELCEYVDSTVKLKEMDEETFRRAAKMFLGNNRVQFKKGATLGVFARVSSFLEKAPQTVANDTQKTERRIAASAEMSGEARFGFKNVP